MTRAKFNCVEICESAAGKKVKFLVVTGSNPENAEFFKWTPTGVIEMGILNPDVTFEVGKDYFVDFTKVE